MNNIIKFNPKLTKHIARNIPPPYKCNNFSYLLKKLLQFKDELKLLLLDTNKDIAFELFSLKFIPSKTSRISKNCLNNLKWHNDGSKFNELENRIILVLWTNRSIIEKNIIFIDQVLNILNSTPLIESENLIALFKTQVSSNTNTEAKKYISSLFSFVENLYDFISMKDELVLEPGIEYISDIMCNHSLFNGKETLKFKKENISQENTKYLINTNKDSIIKFENNDFDSIFLQPLDIPDVTNKSVIGILDGSCPPTKNIIIKDYINSPDDKIYHGQSVSSIAMCGDKMNGFDDGCGVFNILLCRVFNNGMKESEVLEGIKKALNDNPDIRVWNISLGSNNEINPLHSTSYLGSQLDQLSYDSNVIFVISGGNDKDSSKSKLLSPPADSLRSIIVNALDFDNKVATYSRKGKKFLNYQKPDCSIFGGDINKKVCIISGNNYTTSFGTSFAAPFVTRLICGIIEKFPKLNKLEILAIFFNGLEHDNSDEDFFKSRIAPQHIDNYIKQKNNEVLLLFTGITERNKKIIINNDFELPLDGGKFNNKLKVTTVCNGKIDNRYGVESIRTCITSSIAELENENKMNQSRKIKNVFKIDRNLSEWELIKNLGKWSINNTKIFETKVCKSYNSEFVKWIIKLENQNRNSTDYDELTVTQIEYAIAIKITNSANINNYNKLFSRLEILKMLPVKLVEWNIDLDQEIKLTGK